MSWQKAAVTMAKASRSVKYRFSFPVWKGSQRCYSLLLCGAWKQDWESRSKGEGLELGNSGLVLAGPLGHRMARRLPGLRCGCGTLSAGTGAVQAKVTVGRFTPESPSLVPPPLRLKVEGVRLDDCWETDSPGLWGFRRCWNMSRLVKQTFQTWSTGSNTAQKNFSLGVLTCLGLTCLGPVLESRVERALRRCCWLVTLRNKSHLSGVFFTFGGSLTRIPAPGPLCFLWPDHSSHEGKEWGWGHRARAKICVITWMGKHF